MPAIAREIDSSRPLDTLRDALRTSCLDHIFEALDIPHELGQMLPAQTLESWGIEAFSSEVVMLRSAGPAWRVLSVEASVPRAQIITAMRQMARHHSTTWSLWFWFDEGMLCVATALVDGTIRHTSARLEEPRQLELEQLLALAPPEPPRHTWRQQILEALDQAKLTRQFYDDFVRVRRRLAHAMRRGPGAMVARESLALTVLLRVIVLYFLQGRGALDGDRSFLRRRLDAARASGENFWETVLGPLFFGALSLPMEERDDAAKALGEIPFLNGGLFERSALEREHPEMSWPESVWSEVFDGFFERYSFVLRDPLPDVHDSQIDPEMLGRVFEGLMCPGHRSKTGAFYTPAPLVARMVVQGLAGFLSRHTSLEDELLEELVTRGSIATQKKEELQAIASALSEIKILDPAVGTGAFMIEAVDALRRCWRGLREAGLAHHRDVESYEGVRALIHDHIYGVDVNTTAVRLCELRMWLVLLGLWPGDLSSRIAQIEPLPNLGHRIAIGDSLVGPQEHVLLDIKGKRGSSVWRDWRPEEIQSAQVAKSCALIAQHQRRYLGAHGLEKVEAQRELEQIEKAQVIALLDARRARHHHDIRALEELSKSPDLFGEEQGLTASARTQLLMLYRERDALTRRITAAERGDHALTFCYEARFAGVMARGGFDLIFTNPPWVRATTQERQLKGLHGMRYVSASGGLWRGAAKQGVRATFGTQPDLSALFIERSLELLRPGGRLCALVPAKLLRSLHGAAVRGVMAEHHICAIEDMSDGSQAYFDAVTYPAVIDIEKCATKRTVHPSRRGRPTWPQPDTRMITWRGQVARETRQPLASICLHGEDMREPWVITSGAIAALQKKLASTSPEQLDVLGHIEALRPRRGIMTGQNAVFCVSSQRALDLCHGDEALYERWTRPFVRGRDVRAWEFSAQTKNQRILWPYEGKDVVEFEQMPEAMQAHFTRHEAALRTRSDLRSGTAHFWRLFRVQQGVEGAKVIWRDMSLWAEAACDEGGHVPMNTAYYIPCGDELRAWLLTAWMNAWVTRISLHALAERAQHGYRRHFGWTVASMKIPRRWARFVAGGEDPELEANCAFWRGRVDGAQLCERELCDIIGISHEMMLDACGELVRQIKRGA